MAKGKKTGGKDFVKGRPKTGGTVPLNDEQKEIKKELKRTSGKLKVAKYVLMSQSELDEIVKGLDKKKIDLPVIDVFCANVICKGINKADLNVLNWIFSILGWDFDEERLRKEKALMATMIRESANLEFE